MSSSKNLEFEKTSFLSKSNSAFIEQMYLKFINKDKDLPESWQSYFEGMSEDLSMIAKEINGPSWGIKQKIDIDELQKRIEQEDENLLNKAQQVNVNQINSPRSNEDSIKAVSMIRSYRQRGHLIAKLDPLELLKSDYLDELHPESFGFKKEDYQKNIYLGGVINKDQSNIKEILAFLKKTYCGPIGYEYMHISNPTERKWFRDRIEKSDDNINFTKNGKEAILNKLIQAEGFEKFLHKKYVGTKRFGLDGGESLIPALEQIIKISGQSAVKEVKIGMSHRGRLNVLANVLQKSYKRIFNEFAGEINASSEEGAGDVKYHLGASSNRDFDGNSVHVSLTDNPSHLEAVNPVVLGQTRAKQFFHKDKERNKVIPILIHGDAAFAGQGVVAECFAMSGLPGHNTGGTIHIIVNNQIGFTTSPRFARSSPYPSDVAKMVDAPIIHANGDDPEAVVYAARIATEFRLKFNRDVVIDLICYRRFGHNEGDEPSFTQPLMYEKIRSHPSPVKVNGNKLVDENTITIQFHKYIERVEGRKVFIKNNRKLISFVTPFKNCYVGATGGVREAGVKTGVYKVYNNTTDKYLFDMEVLSGVQEGAYELMAAEHKFKNMEALLSMGSKSCQFNYNNKITSVSIPWSKQCLCKPRLNKLLLSADGRVDCMNKSQNVCLIRSKIKTDVICFSMYKGQLVSWRESIQIR